MSRKSLDDLRTLITYPLFTIVFIAVLESSGRADLASYALVASLLLMVTGMAFLVAGELVVRERNGQTLELLVATPAPFFLVLVPRITLLTSLGIIGLAEAWIVVRWLFGVSVAVHHPWLLVATMLVTIFAATGTALITAAFLCFGRTPRTIQNAIVYPFYVLGGVLVPVAFLPDWLEPLSRVIFLYWAAELLRDSLQAAEPENVIVNLAALAFLGLAGGVLGATLLRRMLDLLRREGSLSLT